MGWKGTLRAMEAASRRAERESQRRYRQLARDSALHAKMEARQRAAHEVDVYENQIERLLSIHKESPERWDWNLIYNTPPPMPPERSTVREVRAQSALDSFKPTFWDKILRRIETKQQALQKSLEMAQAQDEQEYQKAYRDYYQRHTDWDERRQLAWRIIQGDVQAFGEALADVNPLVDVGELGVSIEFVGHNAHLVELRLTANSESLVPSEIKSLTATGKVSVKPMPKARYYEIYRDFVSGVALRIGRELFAFLPVEAVIATVHANLVNPRTGRQGVEAILSVAMYRPVFATLNFNRLTPFDAIDNFLRRVNFSKTTGFASIEAISKEEAYGTRPEKSPEQPLVALRQHPSMAGARLERFLADIRPTDGCYWLPVAKAADLANIFQETKLTAGMSRRIAERIDLAGYCVEPDARVDCGPYVWGQVIGVFKPYSGDSTQSSPGYLGSANLLKLCVLIAGADGGINHQELNVFHEVMKGQLYLTQTDRQRLSILEKVLEADDSIAKRTVSKVAKSIPPQNRQTIAQLLVQVASADNVISKSEYRALERIFKAFELPADTLSNLIQKFGPSSGEVTIQEASRGAEGETIAVRTAVAPRNGFALNMARVNAITNETKEVIGILSGVMEDDISSEVSAEKSDGVENSKPKGSLVNDQNSKSSRFEGLDGALHSIFERLLTRDSWTRAEFHTLANEFHLMPLGAYDSINEWADEKFGDFILEGEDPVNVRSELINKRGN